MRNDATRSLAGLALLAAVSLPARAAAPSELPDPRVPEPLTIRMRSTASSAPAIRHASGTFVSISAPRTIPGNDSGFLRSYLGPELALHAEAHAYYLGSPVYGFLRESSSNGHFETTNAIERDAVKAVRRATRDWVLDEAGIDRLAITFRPVTDALDRVDSHLRPAEGSATTIRLGFSRLFPRIVIDRVTSSGVFRFRATLDGKTGADFRAATPRAPWVGTDVDLRERTARFRLGVSF